MKMRKEVVFSHLKEAKSSGRLVGGLTLKLAAGRDRGAQLRPSDGGVGQRKMTRGNPGNPPGGDRGTGPFWFLAFNLSLQ